MKFLKITFKITTTLIIFIIVFINFININVLSKNVINENSSLIDISLNSIIQDLFDDVNISRKEVLLNLDNSADYLYIENRNGGYVVFLKETMEMLEYSKSGKISFPNDSSNKYYCGPGQYYYNKSDYLIDVNSKDYFILSADERKHYAETTRTNLYKNYKEKCLDQNILTTPIDINNIVVNVNLNYDSTIGGSPTLDKNNLIRLTDGNYIANYNYFLNDPTHGNNDDEYCGAVACQLLLSYHNFYSNRKIIKNQYLNTGGTSEDPDCYNPNYCSNPMCMKSETLGTNGLSAVDAENPNNYFAYLVNYFPNNSSIFQIYTGMDNVFDDINRYTSNPVLYSHGIGVYLTSETVVSEIDQGRPVILLMQDSLGGADHYVVAYGYNSYTYPGTTQSYFGYITHFGWLTKNKGFSNEINYYNVWINSAWCAWIYHLNIDHTHSYLFHHNVEGTSQIEYRCSTCNHRTDAAISVTASQHYVERCLSLPENNLPYKDFYIKFNTEGNKIIQTFGTNDTLLFLYNSDYNLLVYDDDSGYSLNSLINFNFQSNVTYILRVKFYSNSSSGNIKISLLPSSITYNNYESICYSNSSSYTYSFNTTLGSSYLLTYQPLVTGVYSISTGYIGDNINSCLYLIDPESIDTRLYDTSSGGDLQGNITTQLDSSKIYLIVVAPDLFNAVSGNVIVNVAKIT